MSAIRWNVRAGDLLDEPADVLVCSANPFLTLSGGVGGALLLRYGPALQDELNAHLRSIGRRHVGPGTIVVTRPPGTPYAAVLHAVAVDAFYRSSVDRIAETIRASLRAAAGLDARTVAMAALATGYGRQPIETFAAAAGEASAEAFGSVEWVTVVVRQADQAAAIASAFSRVNRN